MASTPNALGWEPCFDFLLIKINESASVSQGGLHLPQQYQRRRAEGEVIAVGPDCKRFKVGDIVAYNEHNGEYVQKDRVDYIFISEQHIISIKSK